MPSPHHPLAPPPLLPQDQYAEERKGKLKQKKEERHSKKRKQGLGGGKNLIIHISWPEVELRATQPYSVVAKTSKCRQIKDVYLHDVRYGTHTLTLAHAECNKLTVSSERSGQLLLSNS